MEYCDSKNCSEGKHAGGSAYVCPHNNLKIRYPKLALEWHIDNKSMETYAHRSGKKVKWICQENHCGCHVWDARIADRTREDGKTGCPYCSGRYACEHYNLELERPDLIPEWDPTNKLPMSKYCPSSGQKVKWICPKNPCGCHNWVESILNRDKNHNNGCPFCVNKKVCSHNNLEIKHPELKCEWDTSNKLPMNSYTRGSKEKVNWKCAKKGHVWEATIHSRTGKQKNGCPYCSNQRVCDDNNLEVLFSHLSIEWHPDNKHMNQYTPGSDSIVKWICPTNKEHMWSTNVYHRTGKGKTGCPHCCNTKGYSKAQIKWIKSIELKENIKIQHALCPEGEHKIPDIGKVDGFCKETNTVYEFHGDYWHGNPDVYKCREELNLRNNTKYGELYEKTVTRDIKIRELGYTLIVMWENDYNNTLKDNI